MVLNNRKISQDDYNIFLEGIHATYGSSYGKIAVNISRALRHYGLHLLNDDLDHVVQTETDDRKTSSNKKRRTQIFEPAKPDDESSDSNTDQK